LSSEEGINGTSTNEVDGAVVAAPAAPGEADEEELMDNEGEPNAIVNQRSGGRSMGKGLERMSRGLNSKLPVVIVEGKRRPEAPIQAAKLASEGGIVLRQHMPIHPHWKEYKKDESVHKDFVGKVSVKFSMDPCSENCSCTSGFWTNRRASPVIFSPFFFCLISSHYGWVSSALSFGYLLESVFTAEIQWHF